MRGNRGVSSAGALFALIILSAPRAASAFYTVTTLAGGGRAGNTSGSAEGVGTNALFSTPFGVAVNSEGTVFVVDSSNNKLCAIKPDGTVSTLAGGGANGKTPVRTDGVGTNALFNYMYDVSTVSSESGTVFVADTTNSVVRAVTLGGNVTTVAAGFLYPYSVSIATSGAVYVADTTNNIVVVITSDGRRTLAGGFNLPRGVAAGPANVVFVADTGNHRISTISPGGAVATLAGGGADGVTPGSNDGIGTSALFFCPSGVAIDSAGTLYVADFYNQKVRAISPGGTVITIGGGGADGSSAGSVDGVGTNALFFNPSGIAVDSMNAVYVADCHNNKVRKLVPPVPSLSPTPSSRYTRTISSTPSPELTGSVTGTALFSSSPLATLSSSPLTTLLPSMSPPRSSTPTPSSLPSTSPPPTPSPTRSAYS